MSSFVKKSALAKRYKVSLPTLRNYLKSVPGIDVNKRKFSPQELTIIYTKLGEP